MTEPHYDSPVRIAHDGRDPPVPRRVKFMQLRFAEDDVPGQTSSGNLIAHVYYGNSDDKNDLLSGGAYPLDPVNGYEIPDGKTATHAFVQVTFRGWQAKDLSQYSWVILPL